MYDYLQGFLQTVESEFLVIDVGGVGYKIFISKREASRCLPIKSSIKLFTDLIIREDAHILYGFSQNNDREIFRLLLQVNGIGPRVALNIISNASLPHLVGALQQKDSRFLSAIPGIGKKLAERLIVELHEKIFPFLERTSSHEQTTAPLSLDACKALETLGLPIHETRALISKVQHLHPSISTVEGLVQQALVLKHEAKK
jgi:holliday junction DNA helicase RuvA